MIPDAAQSFDAMPASLAAKVGKFYAINAFNTASALRAQAANQPQYSIDEIIEWLDEIWLYEDLADYITEAEYLEFRESIKATEE